MSNLYYLSIQSSSSFTLSSFKFKSYCQFAKCVFELAHVLSEQAPLLSARHYQHTGSYKPQRKLLIFLEDQQTPALKHSPSALLFSTHRHTATTLFKIPPAHCRAVIFRSPAQLACEDFCDSW